MNLPQSDGRDCKVANGSGRVLLRRLTVQTSNAYYYDPERVQSLYDQFRPDPAQYGDEPVFALWEYLHGSPLGQDVFEEQGDFDQWPESDEPSAWEGVDG